MADTASPRKLATIVALDVAGYSARTEADEAKTTAEVAALRAVIETIAAKHGGRVFNTAGDGFMLEFVSSLAAVEAALELAETCEPKVRVGVHLGDVVVQPNGDLLGHGVNVAARLMAKSDPGGALVSATVRQTIRGPIADRLVSRGLFQLDKMAETIGAFALSAPTSFAPARAKGAEPLLAVLPFDNLSNDPEMLFFSDGVSEEILHTVARAKGLRVIGRTSSFQFRGADKSVRKVSNELHATHVLDGSVRRSANQIRVGAHLIETATQTTVWTARFDRDVSEIFALQDHIAAEVAKALETVLPVQRHHSVDPQAVDLYLKARRLVRDFGLDGLRQAVVLIERAVAIAPDFAEAWAELGAVRALLLPRTRDALGTAPHDAALAAANRALVLDPSCAGGYRTLAMLKPAFAEHGEKLHLVELALTHAPNDPVIASAAGSAMLTVGRYREATALYERAAELDPISPYLLAHAAFFRAGSGHVEEALATFANIRERMPQTPWVIILQCIVNFYSGRFDEAEHLLTNEAQAFSAIGQSRRNVYLRHLAVLRAAQSDRAELVRSMFASSPVLTLNDCSAATFAGCGDLAYAHLFDAFTTGRSVAQQPDDFGGGAVRAYVPCAVFFMNGTALRNDKRFPGFCHHAGLTDYWFATGRWPDCATEVPYDFRAECEKAARDLSAR